MKQLSANVSTVILHIKFILRTGSGVHPDNSYPVGTAGSYSGPWSWPLTSI